MPYEIEIETPKDSCIVVVDEVDFNDEGTMLFRNCDPKDIPEPIKEVFRFHSHRLTAIILEQNRIESLTVSTHLAEDDLTAL